MRTRVGRTLIGVEEPAGGDAVAATVEEAATVEDLRTSAQECVRRKYSHWQQPY